MRRLLLGLALIALFASAARAEAPEPRDWDPRDWDAVLEKAGGQTVYWHAWGGEPRINDYISWVGEQVKARHDVEIRHVKLSDTSEAVSRVVAERAAGRDDDGSVDLIWINGENFAAMKRNDLLFGPWSEELPNYRHVDVEGKPTVTTDFTVPVEGLEAPWGMAQVVFYYDSARLEDPPQSAMALLAWAEENPGRFTYPQPPNFLGTTFLKQVLHAIAPDQGKLTEPVEEAGFQNTVAPLWEYLSRLHPAMWRNARAFPQNSTAQRTLMADNEIDMAISFNPNEASTAIANNELPPSVRTLVFEGGTIGNTSFVAIPYNASAKAGAMAVANFLLSPEAQARKQDPKVWGSYTVLDVEGLPPEDRALFETLELGEATLAPEELGTPLPEPHPSWMTRIEEEWLRRYGVTQ